MYDCGGMEYDGDTGSSGFGNAEGFNFGNAGSGNSNVKFSFNGQNV
jgi:hypothetical protein